MSFIESINENDFDNNGHVEHKRSSCDSPGQEFVRHVRVRDFIERKRDDVHKEHSDQSVQQDQLLFKDPIQDKHSRFSISLPKQRFPKHVRRRVSIEPVIPQPG